MTSPSPLLRERDYPYPPRYRWLKRGLLIVFVAAVLLAGLRYWWSVVADRRLKAELDVIRASGRPATWADYQFPNLPDSQNAAAYYRQAVSGWKHSNGPAADGIDWTQLPTPAQIAVMDSDIHDDAAGFALVRTARTNPKAVWITAFTPTFIAREYNPQRGLANMLMTKAWISNQQGNDAETVECLRDAKHHADALDQYYPMYITFLVADGADVMNSMGVIHLAQNLSIGTAPNAASRQQIKDLIAELSDESVLKQSAIDCVAGEGMQMAYDAENGIDPSLVGAPIAMTDTDILLRPALVQRLRRDIHDYQSMIRAVSQPSYPQAKALMPNGSRHSSFNTLDAIAHYTLVSSTAIYARYPTIYYTGLARRRAAVIALAIRLYRLDHDDHWPDSLDELAPAYVPAVPLDPFSATSAPMQYGLQDPADPTLTSASPGPTIHLLMLPTTTQPD